MLEIFDVVMKTNDTRLGHLKVRYYDLFVRCDICMYKEEKLYIRFPEYWVIGNKFRYVYWDGRETSDKYQKIILDKLLELIGLDFDKALELKRKYWSEKKNADNNKENT